MVAERLLTRQPPPNDELAIHFARAADAPHAVRFGRLAATTAIENGALAEAAYFLQVVVDNEKDARGRAEATGELARLLHMNHELVRADPLLELAGSRLRAVGEDRRALRMDVRRVTGLAEIGATPLSDLLERLTTIKDTARGAEDWEALALALDAEMHLLHRAGEVERIRALFSEMRDCANAPDLAASCVANASLALNVLFGDSDEGLRRAEEAVRLAERTDNRAAALLACHRLIVAHVCRGSLYLPGAETLLRRASESAVASGDLQLRFDLTCNQGVFFLNAGDLDRADVKIMGAAALIEGVDGSRMHHLLNLNKGELALERRDFDAARLHFMAAEAVLRGSPPPWHAAVAAAGIGLAALNVGALSDATRREAELPPDPPEWYFDPIVILMFRAALLDRRRRPTAAVEFLRTQGDVLAQRFPTSSVRSEVLASNISRRAGLPVDRPRQDQALELARSLRLQTRVRQLEACRG